MQWCKRAIHPVESAIANTQQERQTNVYEEIDCFSHSPPQCETVGAVKMIAFMASIVD
jgi:hypothetical protein